MNKPIQSSVLTANKAALHPMPVRNPVVNAVANIISAPSRAVSAVKGAYADVRRSQVTAKTNFRNRSDNSHYYEGTGYWSKNKN